VEGEIARQLALLLPAEDLLEIVVGTKRAVRVVQTGGRPSEACVVVCRELGQKRIACRA
jgi:hypothetical protein